MSIDTEEAAVTLDVFLAAYQNEPDDALVNRLPDDDLLTWGHLRQLLQAYREREAMREALTSIIARVGPAAGGSTLQALSGLSDVEAIARAALRAGTEEWK